MRLLPPPFTDDLGRRVPAAVVTKEVLALVDGDWKRRRALPELKQERDRGGWLLDLLLWVVLAGTMRLLYEWNPLPRVPRGCSFIIFCCACVIVVRPVTPWLLGLVRPGRPAQTRQRFLAALLCPACAHDLKGAPPREDGVTVCPECGAAWKLGEPAQK